MQRTLLLSLFATLACVGQAFLAAPQHQQSTSALSAARRPFISGNWKLNPQSRDEAVKLASDIAASVTVQTAAEVALFVPYVFIEATQNVVGSSLQIGAEVRLYCRGGVYAPESCSSVHVLTISTLAAFDSRRFVPKRVVPSRELFPLPWCNRSVSNGHWLGTRNVESSMENLTRTSTASV